MSIGGHVAYPGGWFGKSWGAPVCSPDTHKPTPIGDQCIDWGGLLLSNDQGMIIPFGGMRPAVLGSHHLDCFLKSIGAPT